MAPSRTGTGCCTPPAWRGPSSAPGWARRAARCTAPATASPTAMRPAGRWRCCAPRRPRPPAAFTTPPPSRAPRSWLPAAGSPWLALAAQAPLERAGGPAALEYTIEYDEEMGDSEFDYEFDDGGPGHSGTEDEDEWEAEERWELEHGCGC
ncbi:MAG: hypothetical protein J3K34DRAFT_183995 [Monoraphidium minutum]|nr:MAG: hypothetical protein J3K34DRAFT_183995 [Monoraphidium minutum]